MSALQRAKLYLVASYLGAAATCLLILALVFGWPDFVRGFSIGLLLVSLLMLLRRRLRDEYFNELWKAGASMAFLAAVVWFLLAEGVAHGLGGIDGGSYWPERMTGIVAIAAFFIGFHAKRLQSR